MALKQKPTPLKNNGKVAMLASQLIADLCCFNPFLMQCQHFIDAFAMVH